jgi:hypothetical protein
MVPPRLEQRAHASQKIVAGEGPRVGLEHVPARQKKRVERYSTAIHRPPEDSAIQALLHIQAAP